MVCPNCTLLCLDHTMTCRQCGHSFQSLPRRMTALTLERAPAATGLISGLGLVACLSLAIMLPLLATQALAVGAYFGIISIANTWLSIYRGDEADLLRGTRGLVYCTALLVSLIGELARLQHVPALPLPPLPGLPMSVPVPSAMMTELVAVGLIVLDPLVVSPLARWIGEGVQREEHSG